MSDRTRKVIGVGGAIAVAVGTVAIIVSGGDVGSAEGIVGLAAVAAAAVAALINGLTR